MSSVDAIDVLLRIAGLRKFIADAEAARASIAKIGATADATTAGAAGAAGAGGSKGKTAAAQAAALGLVRKAAIGTGLAVAGIGFEAAKMSIKFDESMVKLQTQAGEQKKNLGFLSKGVLDMARSVGIGPQSLAEGLYHLESVGIRGKKALEGLKTAADLAAVGGAHLEETTTGLAAAWVTGIKGAGDFTKVAALMNAAVGSGNIRMQALVEALGQGILPAAKVAGLSIQNVFAAISTLTDAGWKASSASAQLATAFHYLYAPTGKASKALAEMHLTGLKLIEVMRSQGLPAALKLLRDHMNEFSKNPNIQAQQMAKIIPGGRGRTLLSLENMIPRLEEKERFQQAATTKKWSEAIAAYHATAAFKIRAAWAGVQSDMIKVGKVLEPLAVVGANILLKVADGVLWLGKAGKDVIMWFKNASTPIKAVALILGIFLGQVVLFVAMVRGWALLTAGIKAARLAMAAFSATSKLALLANPWALIIMAIVMLVIVMVTHWQQAKVVLKSIWDWMSTAWKNTVDWVIGAAETVFNWFKKNWMLLLPILLGPFGIVAALVIKNWKAIADFFSNLPKEIGKAFESLGKIIAYPFEKAFEWIEDKWKKLRKLPGVGLVLGAAESIVGGIGHAITGLAEGGVVTSPGMALIGERGPELLNLPRGASVHPLDSKGHGEGGKFELKSHTTVMLEKKVLAEAVGTYTSDKMMRG